MIYLICIAVYLLSALLWWRYINLAYGKDGIWSNEKPKRDTVSIMFIPLMNTVFVIIGWLCYYPLRKMCKK